MKYSNVRYYAPFIFINEEYETVVTIGIQRIEGSSIPAEFNPLDDNEKKAYRVTRNIISHGDRPRELVGAENQRRRYFEKIENAEQYQGTLASQLVEIGYKAKPHESLDSIRKDNVTLDGWHLFRNSDDEYLEDEPTRVHSRMVSIMRGKRYD